MPTLEETQKAAQVRYLNDLALAAVLREHPAILIRQADLPSWRPCAQECVGVIEGLEHLGNLVPLCTDGCVAWFLGRNVRAEGVGEDDAFLNPFSETFVLFGHVADFNWGGKGAPPQPHTLPPPPAKDHIITPFQSQKDGKWWYVAKSGKWNGPFESEVVAKTAITEFSSRSRDGAPRVPSALDAALDLLRNL